MQDDMGIVLTELEAALGTRGILTGPDACAGYAADQSGLVLGTPGVVLRPADTAETSVAVKICAAHGLPIIPQGGRTGLSGGGCALPGSVVLNCERMTGIEEIDLGAMTMTVHAGTPLQVVQEAAREQGLDYPVDIGARGSATIGGTIATNAGGVRVLRHGMTRQNVLGLEAVLPDGSIMCRLGKTIKDNSGLDLKQLFIGSEGIFGIITRAVLQLRPMTPGYSTALLGLRNHEAALKCLALARSHFKDALAAFEGMWPDYWDHVCQHGLARSPFHERHGFYLLIEAACDQPQDTVQMEGFFEAAHEAGLVQDGVLAQSLAEAQALWQIREVVGEVDASFGPHVNFDIGIAPSQLGGFCDAVDQSLKDLPFPASTLKVGHIGDGNVHLLVACADRDEAKARIETMVYDLLRGYSGTITAEHGIGRVKAPWLTYCRTPVEIALMQRFKESLDPKLIMNPGALIFK
ncbi:FAD/FMN-containing dehydrogenase [Paracoccus pantotrophus]|uniref:FAD-binding oxidoreductase n=1 Tax=Paracoccus pantotrophus TaxID=82367 RepID=A0AAE6NVW2_PARPN|nr:FAD-binding oxidoreductase [Paracoccus pantotrophus]QFG37581.1 FAD-binding oxidoreductase [Paracoccus pantotrophus]RKS51961.1 FAD/FMN-containing dehydrogenase [Paracoccus pantotrophus]